MNILNYLRELLLFSEKVVLPGFGSLKIIKVPAKVSGNKITAPKSELIFDATESMDDDLLSSKLSNAEDLPMEEARQKVLEFIDEIKFSLDKGEAYTIPGLCKILRDEDNNISLEKDSELVLDPDNFGLESFELDDFEEEVQESSETEKRKSDVSEPLKEVEKKEEPDKKVQSEKVTEQTIKESVPVEKSSSVVIPPIRKNNRSTVWFVVGAVVVLMAAIIIISFQTNLTNNELNFDSFFGEEEVIIEDNIPESGDEDFNFDELVNEFEKDIDSITSIKNALKPTETEEDKEAEGSLNEYYIIAGSFKDAKNADDLQKELVLKGYPAITLDLGNGIYRVSAMSFSDKNQALNALITFRESMNMSGAWLMSLE
ncbi:MAG: SPOR domain-containing protein [Bacteroidales bacterium]|nr:SPOR domain-containing protein [Bacteroidales bacterium]MCF8389189.1 SPOR domain-containing protein [Bacteroidales bacterium]